MADVRSLLRAERAARAPPPKIRKQPPTASPPKPNKKRKADDEDNAPNNDTRKRTKAKGSTNLPSGFFDGTVEPDSEDEAIEEPLEGFVAATEAPPSLSPSTSKPLIAPPPNLDDEWAAFEQDIASIPDSKTALDALNANATLESAPISATEAASQSLEGDATVQKGRRDVEIEEEKEDASRALEEEFEEMEVLEERLKRLKEKREQLRLGKGEVVGHIAAQPEIIPEDGSDDDDDDEGDEWDGWRFGTS
jgi:ribosome-associated translation inhibitor RaiA